MKLFSPLLLLLTTLGQTPGSLEALEGEVLELYDQRKWVTARRLSEELLARDRDSIAGHLVIGNVLWEADADFSRAQYHLDRAEELYEDRFVYDPGERWKLHSQIVLSLTWLAAEMDRQEDQLEWIEHYNDHFDPPMVAAQAWPLMELKRYGEAQGIINQALRSERYLERLRAHNSNCAIHAFMGLRREAYDACRASLRHSRDVGDPDITVVARNAADSAWAMTFYDEAERLIDEAATGSNASSTNPPMFKTALLLDQGRGEEALLQAEEMLRWHLSQTPSMRSSSRAQLDSILAQLFLLAGEEERGRQAIERAIRYPDRLGGTSDDPLQRKGGQALLRLAMRKLARERSAERASALGWLGRLRFELEQMWPDTGWWADESLVVQACSDAERLVASFRFHLDAGIGAAGFLKPELVQVLGTGVASVALEEARSAEDYEPAMAFFSIYDVEIAWQEGDEEETLALAQRGLGTLPEAEVLLRAHLAVRGAQAAWELDQRAVALGLFERALQLDPGSLRRRGVRLPATVVVAGRGSVVEAIADTIERSPRLTDDASGFQVAVTGNPDRVELCLRSPAGNRIRCATARRPARDDGVPVDDTAFVRFAADLFHRHLFAMRLGDGNLDLSSLDGTTIKNQTASERMEALLDRL